VFHAFEDVDNMGFQLLPVVGRASKASRTLATSNTEVKIDKDSVLPKTLA
jgi:hypothetical protein